MAGPGSDSHSPRAVGRRARTDDHQPHGQIPVRRAAVHRLYGHRHRARKTVWRRENLLEACEVHGISGTVRPGSRRPLRLRHEPKSPRPGRLRVSETEEQPSGQLHDPREILSQWRLHHRRDPGRVLLGAGDRCRLRGLFPTVQDGTVQQLVSDGARALRLHPRLHEPGRGIPMRCCAGSGSSPCVLSLK